MSIGEFIRDKVIVILCNMLLFIILSAILFIINVKLIIIVFVFCIWFFPLISYITVEFVKYKNYYDEIDRIIEKLDKKYLLPEMLKEADFIQGEKLNRILKEICRDMHENVKYFKDMQADYREYIETWIHEIKTPIASTKLTIENNQNEVTNKIDYQLDRIEGYVEQVLYYSRSNNVSKDYIIKQINLDNVVRNVVKKNYRDFIHKKIKINIKDTNEFVYSDVKWTEFIINQIIGNSIKYSSNKEPIINIHSIKKANSVRLIIEDNGVGIIDKDIHRVFEKGFTGENGRRFSKSTGMGLYLCEKLCLKLGLKINIDSEVNKGTKVMLIFPLSAMETFTDD
ncbi:sensor histidine kinase [Clostridium saccharobutylicum]|uniref:histidine kinase n=1 Tax=Clostridium saccharobutylicum DSM 13864 TaxID=1345695 RepID=U5MQN1_CLOSA|nr:sensor histidine kinase [Clostridium saccharobutylicum]AGX41971.1 sensor histidine kinase YxdK [Clostridium saccharobutylicum DSM 13864]AQR89251.1 sensor histidine kinase GraS [Clostridium saccharobutylicum]AQR99152.1 sensor histidine kinase GraS [Clostridium saccharobutylicum]AQS13140.1 sensor histidine kinase GraS [Clostridium saccharobutylicum]MBA2906253.1 signal transduction histidine kinase [Clostridium saccharobutylicum]